jgi:DNA-binding NarL/FixJ family response regulator
MNKAAEVWIVEDQEVFRQALLTVLNGAVDIQCSLAARTGEEAIAALKEGARPEIVLMDIGLPGMDGIEGTHAIRSLSPSTRVIMLTVHEDNDRIVEAICAGASGYLLKPSSMDEIVDAVRQVLDGGAPINVHIAKKLLSLFQRLSAPRSAAEEYGLTAREREILELLVEGLTTSQISNRLGVSFYTIDTHIRNTYGKLHVHTRGSAVAKALKEKLV